MLRVRPGLTSVFMPFWLVHLVRVSFSVLAIYGNLNGTVFFFFFFSFIFFFFFFSFLFCIAADIALAVSGGSVLALRIVVRVEASPPPICFVCFFVYLSLC